MKILAIRMANHPLYPILSPILSIYSNSLLLPTLVNAPHCLQSSFSLKERESSAGLEPRS